MTTHIKLWFDDVGTLVAFAWPAADQVDLMVHPNHRQLERSALPQIEDEFRQSLTAESTSRAFHYWSYEQDHVRNTMLSEFGYQRLENFLSMYKLALPAKPESRPLPAGYSIRAFAGESEIEARVNVHRAAFHPSKMTVEPVSYTHLYGTLYHQQCGLSLRHSLCFVALLLTLCGK